MIQLRKVNWNDYELLWRVHKLAMHDYVAAVWGWDEAFQAKLFRQQWPSRLKAKVIRKDDADVGWVQVERRADCFFLASIEILPVHQNSGIGTRIIRGIMAEAEDHQLPVRLQVMKANPARTLYERLGFRATGETETHFEIETHGEFSPQGAK